MARYETFSIYYNKVSTCCYLLQVIFGKSSCSEFSKEAYTAVVYHNRYWIQIFLSKLLTPQWPLLALTLVCLPNALLHWLCKIKTGDIRVIILNLEIHIFHRHLKCKTLDTKHLFYQILILSFFYYSVISYHCGFWSFRSFPITFP